MARNLKTTRKKVKIMNKSILNRMKKSILILSAFLISMTMFGQKNELKAADKALDANDFTGAMSAIKQAEALIGSADQKMKAKYYYIKAMATYKNGAAPIDIDKVSAAFYELIDFEKETNKLKYSSEVQELMNSLVNKLATQASNDYQLASQSKLPEDYEKAAKAFYEVSVLSPRDTSFVDNAALTFYLGKQYEKSKGLYMKLLDLGYTGIATQYSATNKDDGKEVIYADKKARDLQVKLGLAENPKEDVKESRRNVIYKYLSLNYVELGDLDKALETIAKGRSEFPDSYSLLIDEANVYYKKGNNDMFKMKLEEAIMMNPTDPTLYYNVGVMNMNQKNIDEAIENFKKAIELKPDYGDAYNNIGAAIIDKANPIIEEMNKSLSDFAKYDKLQAQQLDIYKQAIPYYEKAFEIDTTNIFTVQTLMGLYENCEMTDKLNDLKVVYEGMKE